MGLPHTIFRNVFAILSAVVGEPLQYKQDGLYTVHGADFLKDRLFQESYRIAIEGIDYNPRYVHIEWRVYVCCWAARQALHLKGNFVECGVNQAIFSRAVTHYVNFSGYQDRTFYLLDTFEGIPEQQFTREELALGLQSRYHYSNTFDFVQRAFQGYPNVKLIKGQIPATLELVDDQPIAYLSIDMNAVVPEIAAIRHFWNSLTPGAIVVLDDYNWREHVVQKRAFDEFAKEHDSSVLPLPTGQGIIVKY